MYDYRAELPHVKTPAPRGIRNNNPGNLEAGSNWQGLTKASEYTPDQQAETRFAVFKHPKYGIRALVKILQTYQSKYHLDTIHAIMSRYAPSSENNTVAYALAVAKHVDIGINDQVDLRNPTVIRRMVEAIISHENGMQPYPDDVIADGIALAGMTVASDPFNPPAGAQPPPAANREPDQWVRDETGAWIPVYYDNTNPPVYANPVTDKASKVQSEVEQSTIYKLIARFVPPGYGTNATALVGFVVGLLDIAHDKYMMPALPFIDYNIDGMTWVIGSIGLYFLRRTRG